MNERDSRLSGRIRHFRGLSFAQHRPVRSTGLQNNPRGASALADAAKRIEA